MAVAKNVLKFIMAGLVAIVILHVIFCFYSLLPVHIANPDKNTDYVWEPNSCWIKMTEGISWGRFDAKGFNNMQVIPEPDIIVLGSSHMEATNIMQNSNISFLLNKKLNGKYSVYNMGISGHNFFKICQYISNNIELYNKPPKIIILETSTIEISEQNVKSVINSSVEYTPSYNKGIIGLLQKITVFRLLNQQIEHGLMNLFMPSKNNHIKNDRKNGYDVYENKIDVSAYKKII